MSAESSEFSDLLNSFITFYEQQTEDTFNELDNEIHNTMHLFIGQLRDSLFTYAQTQNIESATEEYCNNLI